MIDLSENRFHAYVDYKEILSHKTDLEIFQFYVPGWSPSLNLIKSPLRLDNYPSFSIFYSDKHNMHLFKDFATGAVGDCFHLVRIMYGISLAETMVKVVYDMDIQITGSNDFNEVKLQFQHEYKKISNVIPKKAKADIGVKYRDFNMNDLKFWKQFEIPRNVLNIYNVVPISFAIINMYVFRVDPYAYAYSEFKENKATTKTYQPYSSDRKFMNNNDASVIEGWTQLPDKGKKVIITSSRKDLMSIASVNRIPSIAPQAESVMISETAMDQLKNRFDEVIVMYDNDYSNPKNPGRTLGRKVSEKYDVRQIEIPSEYQSKDYSDLVKNHSGNTAYNLLNSLI